MDAMDAILTRRSIRKYTAEPVSETDIETILRAAMAGPTAGNQQSWRIIVTTDASTRADMAESTPYGAMLREAPLAFTICGDLRNLQHPQMWQQDCSAAMMNMLTAIHALGLGAVWLGFWPKMERVEPLKEAMGIPPDVEPLGVLAVGHPSETKPPADRYDPEKVRYDRWS